MALAEKFNEQGKPSELVQALRASEPASNGSDDGAVRTGSFNSIKQDLESYSRDWASMVKLLEEARQHLAAAERERDEAYRALNTALPPVEQSAQELKSAMEAYKHGRTGADIDALFERNLAALTSLETAATCLTAQLVWCRSVWQQYADTVGRAKTLRSALKSEAIGRAE